MKKSHIRIFRMLVKKKFPCYDMRVRNVKEKKHGINF